MRKFHSIAALCGDGLRPSLFDRLAVDLDITRQNGDFRKVLP
jgi:hypothetical protein